MKKSITFNRNSKSADTTAFQLTRDSGSSLLLNHYSGSIYPSTIFSFNPELIKSSYQGNDIGLKLDFANTTYQLGQLTGGNLTQLTIDDPTNTISISGSTTITGSLSATGLTEGSGSSHVIMYNTASGQFFFTASAAIGGGGGGNASNDNFQQIFLLMGG